MCAWFTDHERRKALLLHLREHHKVPLPTPWVYGLLPVRFCHLKLQILDRRTPTRLGTNTTRGCSVNPIARPSHKLDLGKSQREIREAINLFSTSFRGVR